MEIQTSKKIYGDDARLRTTSRFYMGFKLAFLLLFTIAFVFQPVSGLSLSRAFMDPENALFPESNSQKMSELDSAEQNQQQLQVEDSLESEAAQGCAVYDNDPIHALMDRICELCHDMFSHQQPNTRAECRSDCFRSNSFKRCLRLFKPVDTNGANGQQARKRRIRFLASTQQ